jgi:hypothetical protein
MEPKELLTLAEWHESQMVLFDTQRTSGGAQRAEKQDELATKAKFHGVAAKMLREAYKKLNSLPDQS